MNKYYLTILAVVATLIIGCSADDTQPNPSQAVENLNNSEKLKVVATTNIVGNLVSNVGGDSIELTTMLPAGADPHTYNPSPKDVAAIANADIVFVNGLNLEEFLGDLISNAGGNAEIVPLSTNINTREFGEADEDEHGEEEHHDEDEHEDGHDEEEHHDEDEDEHEDGHGEEEHHDEDEHEDEHGKEAHHDEDEHEDGHGEEEHHDEDEHEDGHGEEEHHDEDGHEDEHNHTGADPHIWMSPANALVMVHNIEHALSKLDPANAETYDANAKDYEAKLEELDSWVQTQIDSIPDDNRKMLTDHESFGYYADQYGLEIVGTVIPSTSTNAEPSAQELVALQQQITDVGVTAVFVGTTVNPVLAERLAEDTGIQLIPLYTGSLGEAGSGVETYVDFIKYNTNAIVEALK